MAQKGKHMKAATQWSINHGPYIHIQECHTVCPTANGKIHKVMTINQSITNHMPCANGNTLFFLLQTMFWKVKSNSARSYTSQ